MPQKVIFEFRSEHFRKTMKTLESMYANFYEKVDAIQKIIRR